MGLIDFDSTRRVPIVLGNGVETEIYNPDNEAWESYEDLEEDGWTSFYCLIQVGNSVWQMRNKIYELNLETFETTEYDDVPDQLQNAGHCSYIEIDGNRGKILYGYVF